MKIINYISTASIPIIMLLIIGYSFFEKNNIFDIFSQGVKEGGKIIINIFPTLIGLFVAIGVLRSSGLIDLIINFFSPIFNYCNIPVEIIPLAIFTPISGSASIAVATDIMNNYGVDSLIGKIASVIMGSTETTLYIIAIYTGCIKIKNTRGIIFAALIGDIIGIVVSIAVCNLLW